MAVVKRAYKYRFYPTSEQVHHLAQTFGCARFIYNFALNKRKRASFDQGQKLSTKDLSAALMALKKEEGTAWLREVSSVPLQQALRHVDVACKNFFEGRAHSPTFKKKHHAQRVTSTDEEIEPLPETEKTVGIDLGLKSFLVTSDGERRANPKYSARDEKKRAKAQRCHERSRKGSQNRDQARSQSAGEN